MKMGNGSSSVCDGVNIKKQVTILVVGLDNAGKTVTSKALVGESFADVTPTVGFSKFVTKHRGVPVNIYDLGGSSRIRDIWHNYFAEAHGVVYVLDASDPSRMQEARMSLTALMKHSLLRGKPLLLLANKQDHAEALDEIDVADRLQLEMLANECQTPTRIEICSAVQGTGKQIDPIIRVGFQWLVDSILNHYESIQRRVMEDVAKQKAAELLEKEARKERIQKLKAMQNYAAEGINNVSHFLHGGASGEPANGGGNPFRPLHEIAEEWNLPGSVSEENSGRPMTTTQLDTAAAAGPSPSVGGGGGRGVISAPGQLPVDRNSKGKLPVGRMPQQANSASPTVPGKLNNRTGAPPPKAASSSLPPLKRSS